MSVHRTDTTVVYDTAQNISNNHSDNHHYMCCLPEGQSAQICDYCAAVDVSPVYLA